MATRDLDNLIELISSYSISRKENEFVKNKTVQEKERHT